jgi:hypothetical protein
MAISKVVSEVHLNAEGSVGCSRRLNVEKGGRTFSSEQQVGEQRRRKRERTHR